LEKEGRDESAVALSRSSENLTPRGASRAASCEGCSMFGICSEAVFQLVGLELSPCPSSFFNSSAILSNLSRSPATSREPEENRKGGKYS
jgi:hypothetical protein